MVDAEAAVQSHRMQFQNNRIHRVVISLMVLATWFFWYTTPRPVNSGGHNGPEGKDHTLSPSKPFNWSEVVPSSSLVYHDCFDGFQCARLELPMDYHRADGLSRKVAVAVTRLPAKVPVTDPRYGGAVLINPGGPGGSGVAQALTTGRNLQTIVDADIDFLTESHKHNDSFYFDIIGFDPRGVNNTTPQFSCFPSLLSKVNFGLQAEADGILGSSADSLMRNWQRRAALSQSCSEVLLARDGNDSTGEVLGEHLNTVPVARDMLEIIERHAEWREKQGLKRQQEEDKATGYHAEQKIAVRTRWDRGQEKLLYWGRSYGTVLGATFATMFPDRISRMLLDGVVDTDHYYDGGGESSITDADAIFHRFFHYCDVVGLEKCPFYMKGGPSEIREAYKGIESGLRAKSMPVAASSNHGPEVITWSDLKLIQRISVYQPLLTFPLLAKLLADLKRGDGSSMAAFKQGLRPVTCLSEECIGTGSWSQQCTGFETSEDSSSQAILCSDAIYTNTFDLDEFEGIWNGFVADSKSIGDYWASVYLTCVGWQPRAKWRVNGPYAGNTSHPLMLVSTTLDPVTPLKSAKKMSSRFNGSIVLEQSSEGHTTGSGPSVCSAKAIRKYFQTGQLPETGTLCYSDFEPLIDTPQETALIHNMSSTSDRRLYEAMLQDTFTFGFPAGLVT
uniref:Putative hydrolase n=2 Tax=Talaromyces marneffei PM1 TaxID=1077442 RepID=A0A093W186_TALMA